LSKNIIKVLIVEDDPMVAEFNRSFVEQIGHPFKVIGVSSTEAQALEVIKTNTPHLLLLDIFLPNGNGMTLLKTLRKSNILLDIIIITASKDTTTVQEALRFGVVDYLIKPFSFKRFKQSLLNYARIKKIIDSGEDISQADFDSRYSYSQINTDNTSLPKGVHLLTLKQLVDYLYESNKPQSCQEISANISMSRVTTWKYLEYLVKQGQVVVSLEYGVGRPTKLYQLKQ